MNCHEPSQHNFRIKSLNCHRRYEVLASLLNHSDPALFDIICIQEPPPSFLSFPSLCPAQWDRILPFPSDGGEPLKSFLYVSKHVSSCSYSQIQIPHANISAIRIHLNDLFISLFNIYNPPNSSHTIETLQAHLQNFRTGPDSQDALLLVGDFNKHDPLWAGPLHPQRTARSSANPLIDIIIRHGLELCFEPGTPTYLSPAHRSWSTLDLLLVSGESLLPALTYCRTFGGDASDHMGLEAEFKISPQHLEAKARPRLRETDWEAFGKEVPLYFASKPLPTALDSPADLDRLVYRLEEGLALLVKEFVPVSKVSAYRNRWWTEELTNLRKEYRKAQRRIAKLDRSHASWEAMKKARNTYTSAITRQKRAHWKQYLEQLTQAQLWTAARYTDDAPRASTRVPALQSTAGLVSSTEGKGAILFDTFFPSPPANYTPPTVPDVPSTILFEPFRKTDIDRAITRLAPFKAPGPSGIPNIAIKSAQMYLSPVLLSILEASLTLGHFPTPWRKYCTVTLRKPGKSDYTAPKAYRPVALEETLGKVLESVMAERLSALAEAHHLLPDNQYGGRPGRTTTDALLFLTQKIKDAWRTGRIASLLLMDISQAFPTVPHPSLIAKLKLAGLPLVLINWVASFLSNRCTTLSFDDYTSPPRPVTLGIPQGSPLSPILYLLFNADLLQLPSARTDPTSGFIDDVAKLVVTNTVIDNIITLNSFLRDADTWGINNGSRYDYPKFQLIHFWGRKNRPEGEEFSLQFRSHTIKPSLTAKYLGVLLDEKLSFKYHIEMALARGTRSLGALARLKIPHGFMRQLILALVFPRVEYALPVWYAPLGEGPTRRTGHIGTTRSIAKLQRRAAKLITGAFATTASDMADFHAHLLPAHLRLELACFKATARLCTLPEQHPLHAMVKRCRRPVKRHKSALHKMMEAFPELQGSIETVQQARHQDLAITYLTGHIADTRDAAREAAITAIESGSLCIFSDGSGFKGGIGAAAVAIGGTTRTSYEEYMRLRPHSNSEGEEDIDGRTVDPASAYTQNLPFLSSFSSSHSHSLTFSFSHSNISIPLLSTTLSNPGHPMSTVPETRSPNVRRLHLGSDRDHTVFEAEVCGAILGLDLIRATPRATRATLFIDCQAAISAIKQPKAQYGQYLLDTFRNELQRLRKARQTLRLDIHWVPGHEDVSANEWVDTEAKTAAENPHDNQLGRLRSLSRPLPASAAALIAARKKLVARKWKTEWGASPSAKRLRPVDKTSPSRGVRAIYKERSRNECAVLTQLRTGHAPLNAHLYRINCADSPLCSSCGVPETTAHFLITCRRFAIHRRVLRTALRNRPLTLRLLVGPGARIGPVVQFVKDTDRFPHLFPTSTNTMATDNLDHPQE